MNERNLRNSNIAFVGGSGGIGLATALAMAKRGANILIVGRNKTRGEQAVTLAKAAGANDATWLSADISTIAGMARVAEGIRTWRPALHGLVHSAVTVKHHHTTTPDGLEIAFASQYLARYALNRAIIKQLAASGDGRIIHIGAKAPKGFMPNFNDLQFKQRKWRLLSALMSSQVLGYLHIQEAAQQWRELPITASIVCVGPTKTNNVLEQPLWIRALYGLIATTPERSAENAITLLSAAQTHSANGAIFFAPKRFAPTKLVYDAQSTSQAWEHAEQLIREHNPAFAEQLS